MERLLAGIVVLTVFLVPALPPGWTIGVAADPRRILAIASLAHSPGLLWVFGSLPVPGQEHFCQAGSPARAARRRFSHVLYT